jgi:uncharacterized membrane protein YgaE (UPF0421/DUF939 family)
MALQTLLALFLAIIITQILGLKTATMAFIVSTFMASMLVGINLSIRILTKLSVITGLIIGLAFLTAYLSLTNIYIATVLIVLWAFAGAYSNVFGRLPGALGFIGLMSYVLGVMVVVTPKASPISWALWGFSGAMISSFVMMVPKLIQNKRKIRRVVANCILPDSSFKTILYARSFLVGGSDPKLESVVEIGRRLIIARIYGRRIMANISGDPQSVFQDFMESSDDLSRCMASSLMDENSGPEMSMEPLNRDLYRLEELLKSKGGSALDGQVLAAYESSRNIRNIFEDALDVFNERKSFKIPDINLKPKESFLSTLKANLSLENMWIRHGLRLAIAVAAGFVVANFFSLQSSLWIVISILVVLQPDIGSTQNKMVLRIAATLLGVTVAITLSGFLTYAGLVWVLWILSGMMFLTMIAYRNVSYPITLIASTMSIIFIQAPSHVLMTGFARSLDILIGSLIAVCMVYLILPTRLKVDVPGEVENRLAATGDYIHMVILPVLKNAATNEKAFSAFKSMEISRNNLEAGIKKVQNSFDDADSDISSYRSVADSLDVLTADLTAFITQFKRMELTEEPENIALAVEKILKPLVEGIDSVLMDILRSMQEGKIPYDSNNFDELIQGYTANANFSSERGEGIESEVAESLNVTSDEPSDELNQSYHLNVFNEYKNWLISDTHALQDSIRSATVSGALKRYKDL